VMITTFIGRDRLNRLVIPSPGIESPGRLAAICFGRKPIFPSASASACCVVQGCQLLDDPALMLCPCATPPEVGVPAMTSSLRFFAWCESPVARATYPRFTRVRPGSCAAEISCTRRSATRWSNLARPGRFYFNFKPATLMGFFQPFAVFLHPRVPVFNAGMLGCFTTCRFRSSTVHPHMPLSFIHFTR
jgi:hypothetical protein